VCAPATQTCELAAGADAAVAARDAPQLDGASVTVDAGTQLDGGNGNAGGNCGRNGSSGGGGGGGAGFIYVFPAQTLGGAISPPP
jgi:hypothetical protein